MFKSHARPTLVKERFPKFFSPQKLKKLEKICPRKKEKRKSRRLSIEVSKVATHLWPKITPCRQPPHSWAHNPSAKKAPVSPMLGSLPMETLLFFEFN